MTPIKAILIDDEAAGIRSLKAELEGYFSDIEVIATFQDPLKALEEIPLLNPDVLFLDIEMPRLNGFEFLERYGLVNFEIIFVTAYNEFAIQAFEVNAIAYLIKPVRKSKLEKAIEKSLPEPLKLILNFSI
ncbi:MAG: response regulator, partial [Bacteroidota bacterium]